MESAFEAEPELFFPPDPDADELFPVPFCLLLFCCVLFCCVPAELVFSLAAVTTPVFPWEFSTSCGLSCSTTAYCASELSAVLSVELSAELSVELL